MRHEAARGVGRRTVPRQGAYIPYLERGYDVQFVLRKISFDMIYSESKDIKSIKKQSYNAFLTSLRKKKTGRMGFTLVELLICIAIIGTLAAMGTIRYNKLLTQTKYKMAETQLMKLETYIDYYLQEHGELPETLDDLGMGPFLDPWGNPYRYHALENVPPGHWRKDRFLVPLNTDYDLWSAGPDGQSISPLTAMQSRDDIIRANDGAYIGPASQY